MNLHEICQRVIKNAENLGYSTDWKMAGTGTIYVTVVFSGDDDGVGALDDYKIRIATHGECYCSEDISIDPQGCTIEQVITRLATRRGLKAPSWIQANATKAATRARERKEKQALWEAGRRERSIADAKERIQNGGKKARARARKKLSAFLECKVGAR